MGAGVGRWAAEIPDPRDGEGDGQPYPAFLPTGLPEKGLQDPEMGLKEGIPGSSQRASERGRKLGQHPTWLWCG